MEFFLIPTILLFFSRERQGQYRFDSCAYFQLLSNPSILPFRKTNYTNLEIQRRHILYSRRRHRRERPLLLLPRRSFISGTKWAASIPSSRSHTHAPTTSVAGPSQLSLENLKSAFNLLFGRLGLQ